MQETLISVEEEGRVYDALKPLPHIPNPLEQNLIDQNLKNVIIIVFMIMEFLHGTLMEIINQEAKTLKEFNKGWQKTSDALANTHVDGSRNMDYYSKLHILMGIVFGVLIPIARSQLTNHANISQYLEFAQDKFGKVSDSVITTLSQSSQMHNQGDITTRQQFNEASRMQVQTEQERQRNDSEQEKSLRHSQRSVLESAGRLYEVSRA